MKDDTGLTGSSDIVATIENDKDPTQSIAMLYLREENAFVTSGIKVHFDEREILIPAYLVVMDLRLMGDIPLKGFNRGFAGIFHGYEKAFPD